VCGTCGEEIWENAKPCANALVVEDDCVLLIRRARAPWRGAWSAPGGFCEGDEHPALAAEREVLEESGVQARVTSLLGIWIDRYADDPTDRTADAISVAYYLAEPVAGAPTVPFDETEILEQGWFHLDALPLGLAPPGTFLQVLAAARAVLAEGADARPLFDVPGR
jgi:ADP-ribose pyrophosphatase YjhB (NUDIX family)